MGDLVGNLVIQFNQYFKSLPPLKRMAMLTAAAIAMLSGVAVLLIMSGTNHGVLFKNVSPDSLPLLVDKLRQKNIPFSLEDNGSTILVPKEMLHSTQMTIMSEMSGSKFGTIGLELFDKQDFGVTSYAQKVNYQRALQGELIRAINTLSAVKNTKVVLAIPPKKTFLEEGGTPSASIIVDLFPGKRLTQEQVDGIASYVASAVEGMEPDRVTILSSGGKQLSRKFGQNQATAELMEIKAKVEARLKKRIEDMLTRVVGEGKVEAQVNAKLNPRKTNVVQELIDPDQTAIRSQTSEEELLDGARTNPAGLPGARANLPGAGDQGQVGFRQNVRKELKTQNYAVPKTVRNTAESAGNIEQLTVSVLVDGKTVRATDEEGNVTESWNPREAQELAKYEQIVKNAIGFNPQRGDSVVIENIQFEKVDFSETDKILTTLERKKLLHSLFKWSLLGFSLALFFFIVIRPFMRWVTDSFQDTVEDMLPRTIEELEELQSVDNSLPGMSGALPVLEESLDPDKAESELLKERIMALLENEEEKATGAFSLWLSRRDM